MREMRVSPEGNAVAIRSDAAEGEWNAWFVGGIPTGGHWSDGDDVRGWNSLVEVSTTP